MTFERSRNWELIKRIVTHPKVYPSVSDDSSPSADKWEPIQNDAFWYIVPKDGEEVLGVWLFIQHNAATWWIHTCILPSAYGERARKAAEELGPWLWANTPFLRVITEVPDYNRLALRFALMSGMKEFGCNPRSYLKDGQLHDVILLGISKPGIR